MNKISAKNKQYKEKLNNTLVKDNELNKILVEYETLIKDHQELKSLNKTLNYKINDLKSNSNKNILNMNLEKNKKALNDNKTISELKEINKE